MDDHSRIVVTSRASGTSSASGISKAPKTFRASGASGASGVPDASEAVETSEAPNASVASSASPSGEQGESQGARGSFRRSLSTAFGSGGHAIRYALIGIIAAALILILGFWPTALLAAFALVGALIGSYRDGDPKTQAAMRSLLNRMR